MAPGIVGPGIKPYIVAHNLVVPAPWQDLDFQHHM
jgi:hypothetical protein